MERIEIPSRPALVSRLSSVTMRFLTSIRFWLHFAVAAAQVDYSQYVNPFIGSEGPFPGKGYGGGDIFIGGARPFGVAKVGIDSTAANWSIAVLNGGWTPDGNVTAISMFSGDLNGLLTVVAMMHESGTGGAPKYGIIPQMPLTSIAPPVNVLDNLTYNQPRVCSHFSSQLYLYV